MKRVQLFEFEDQSWFPGKIRISMTKLIVVLHKMMGLGDVLKELIEEGLKRSGHQNVVDMGSGSGGPMVEIFRSIRKENEKFSITLSDLYPNEETIASIEKLELDGLTYHEHSIDATNLKDAPKGLKTMVNSFHHTNPKQAKEILQSAADNKEAILIYEMAENKIPLLLWWLFLPLSLVILIIMVLFMTPFVKPLTGYQLFFTYIIPLIPIFYAWDGQASLPRMYTLSDVDELLKDVDSTNYTWEKAPAKNQKGKNQGYYILGIPKSE
jgi:hypothetical protein